MPSSIAHLYARTVSAAIFVTGLAACAPPPEPVAQAPAAPAKLGYTCADNAINCAYKNRDHRPPAGTMAPVGAAREVKRNQGPLPQMDVPHALAEVQIGKLRWTDQRWILNATITAAAVRPIDPEILCTFTNAGQPVAASPFRANDMPAGQSVEVEMIGPMVSATYVDGATCKVVRPLSY